MVGVQRWTAREVTALREVLRQSKREFASKLGVSHRTVTNWEEGTHRIAPFSAAMLDRTLAGADQATQQRFDEVIGAPGSTVLDRATVPTTAADCLASLAAGIASAYDIGRLDSLTDRWFGSTFHDVFLTHGSDAEVIRGVVARAARLGRLVELAARLRHDSDDPVFDVVLQQILMLDGRTAAVLLAPPLEPGMVHRSDDLDAVVALLDDAASADPAPVVAIWGPGGFGKTTLATQVCHDPRITTMFSQVLWVETGEQCSPARIVQLISDLCVHLDGERPALSDAEQAGFHLARVLGERRALLIVDNVWSAADLGPFLLGGPRCVRLVTTRNLRVCPSHVAAARLGPMSAPQIRELLARSVAGIPLGDAAYLAQLCAGWPLLASIVGSNVGQDVAAGAPHHRAVTEAVSALQTVGPHAFDIWDPSQRRTAIGQAIDSSLASLQDTISVGGATDLRARYLSLAIFPAATPVPLSVLSTWWTREYGWTSSAVRQFCRLLADRSLLAAYRSDQDVIVLHDVFRAYLRHLIGPDEPRLHRSLIEAHRPPEGGDWSLLPDHEDYLWRHLPYHLLAAGLTDELVTLVARPHYVVKKARLCGPESLVADHAAVTATSNEDATARSPGNRRKATAVALTEGAYLLTGITSPGDIAATLLISLLRSNPRPDPDAVEELRRLTAQARGFAIDWVLDDPSPTVQGHVGSVTGIATHGDLIVSGGEDGTVKLWDRHGQRPPRTLLGHTGWVFAVAITSDGQVIASAGDDGIIRLWDADTGAPAAVLAGHTRRIRSLAFTRNGRLLVSGGDDGQVCLWDTDRPGLVRTMKTPGCPIWSVAVGCSDTTIVAAGEDEYLRLYDVASGRLVDEKTAHRDWIRAVAFATDVATVATGSGDGTASTWTVTDQRLTAAERIPRQPTRIRSVALSPDADMLITAGEDATLRAYTTGQPTGTQRSLPHVDWIRAIARDERGTIIAGCEDGSVRAWENLEQDDPVVIGPGRNTVWAAASARDGQLALFGEGDGTLQIRDAATAGVLRSVSAGSGRIWSLASGGALISAACGDGAVRLWSLDDEDWTLQLSNYRDRTWAVAVNAAGTRLATSTRGAIQVWDLPSGRLRWTQSAHDGERIRTLAFDHSGDLLISGGGDGAARLWQTSTSTQLAEYRNPGGWVRAVAINYSGDRVAVGYGPGDIRVHDVGADKPLGELTGHNGRPLLVSFTADPDLLISAAADGTVRAWSLGEQRQRATVRTAASLHCAAFDISTASVLAASASGVVRITAIDRAEKG